MTEAECLRELKSLKRHLREIPKFDHYERAEALACIAHIRARQFKLACVAAANAHAKDQRYEARLRRTMKPTKS